MKTTSHDEKEATWTEKLNLAQVAFSLFVAVVGTAITIGIFTGSQSTRLDAVEKNVDTKVSKETYEADSKAIKESTKRIEELLNEVRKEQLEQIKRERRR